MAQTQRNVEMDNMKFENFVKIEKKEIEYRLKTLPDYYADLVKLGEFKDGDFYISKEAIASYNKNRPVKNNTKTETKRASATSAEYVNPSGPPMTELVTNFSKSIFAWAKAGFKVVSEEDFAKRKEICGSCEFWKGDANMGTGKCLKCGCSGAKLWLATSTCPINKWGQVIAQEHQSPTTETPGGQSTQASQ